MANKVTYRQISEVCGYSITTVAKALSGKKTFSPAAMEAIRRTADKLGFKFLTPEERKKQTKERNMAKKMQHKIMRYGGFVSAEKQNEYMIALRTLQGFSNAQISRKVGLTIQTVRRRIGAEPEDMLKENRLAGQKHRSAEIKRRKAYVDTHLVKEYNDLIAECTTLQQRAADMVHQVEELSARIKKMKPDVKKAKLSTVKPAELPVMNFIPAPAKLPVQ